MTVPDVARHVPRNAAHIWWGIYGTWEGRELRVRRERGGEGTIVPATHTSACILPREAGRGAHVQRPHLVTRLAAWLAVPAGCSKLAPAAHSRGAAAELDKSCDICMEDDNEKTCYLLLKDPTSKPCRHAFCRSCTDKGNRKNDRNRRNPWCSNVKKEKTPGGGGGTRPHSGQGRAGWARAERLDPSGAKSSWASGRAAD